MKQLVTGAVIHRLTGRKDVVKILNKFNNSVSYDDVLKQNETWSRMVQQSDGWANAMVKGIATHVTLDNNDGRQETATGAGTTHDTNFTIFQPVLKDEIHQRNQHDHAGKVLGTPGGRLVQHQEGEGQPHEGPHGDPAPGGP